MVCFSKMIKKFLFYGFGGSLSFLITISITYFLTEKLNIYYLISGIIGYLSGWIVNFIFQAYVTFKTKGYLFLLRLTKFLFFQFIGLLIYSIFLFIFTDILKIYYLISLILSSLITFIINFLFANFFIFI